MAKSKFFLFRKISAKEKNSLLMAIYTQFSEIPFVRIGLKSGKARKTWFEFVEQLTLTSLLWYLSQKTQNIAVRILLFITGGFWFVAALGYMFAIQGIIFESIAKKGKFWWQFLVL